MRGQEGLYGSLQSEGEKERSKFESEDEEKRGLT